MLIEIKVKIELSIIRLDILLVRLKQTMDVHSESSLKTSFCKTATFGTQNAPFWNAKRTVLERKTHRFGTAFVSFSFTISYEGQFSEDFSPVLAP